MILKLPTIVQKIHRNYTIVRNDTEPTMTKDTPEPTMVRDDTEPTMTEDTPETTIIRDDTHPTR